MKVILTKTARNHAPAPNAWTAAAYMIESIDLPVGTVDTMDRRIKLLNPANLKAVNAAALKAKSELDLDAGPIAASRSTSDRAPERKTRENRRPMPAKEPGSGVSVE